MAEKTSATRGKFDKYELVIYDWNDEVILYRYFIQDENAIAWLLIMWLPKWKGRRALMRAHLIELDSNKVIWSLGRIEEEPA